jgi:hypothetical protein
MTHQYVIVCIVHALLVGRSGAQLSRHKRAIAGYDQTNSAQANHYNGPDNIFLRKVDTLATCLHKYA